MSFKTPEEVVAYIKEEGVEFVDVRFTDVPGIEQHFTIPASAFDEDAKAWHSTVPRFVVSLPSTSPTWHCYPT